MSVFGAWFSATPHGGRVEPAGDRAISVVGADGTTTDIAVADLHWIGFLFVGDAFSPVNEGWWLFGRADDTVAVFVDCPRVDTLMREPPLSTAADALTDKVRIDVASRPRELRGRDARDGIVRLDPAASERLRRRGVSIPVTAVADFPTII